MDLYSRPDGKTSGFSFHWH